MNWITNQAQNEVAVGKMANLQRTLPGEIARLEKLGQQLHTEIRRLQQEKANLEARREFQSGYNRCSEAMLGAFLTARRMIDYWYRVADPRVLKLRPEARELMIVLGTLIVGESMLKAPFDDNIPPTREASMRWAYSRMVRGYKHAFNLLSEGTPASVVRNYLYRLHQDPDAVPPVPLKRDMKNAVQMDELGFPSEDAASAFIGMASAGMNL